MSMSVTVKTSPNTLGEAALSKKIHEAVAKLIEEAGGGPNRVQRTRTFYEYPQADGSVLHTMGGLEDSVAHYIHVDGAEIPHPKVG